MSSPQALPNILVAEDDPNDLTLLLEMFSDVGVAHPVATFGNGVELIDFLRRLCAEENGALWGQPRLLLLDLHIPQVDGCGVIAWARKQKPLAKLRIVVVSGSGDSMDVSRAQILGAHRVLVKPLPESVLHEEIKRLGEPPRQ